MSKLNDERWRAARERISYELKLADLKNRYDNLRDECRPLDAGGDAVCSVCGEDMGAYMELSRFYSFCPFCGARIVWDGHWRGEFAC